MDSRLPADAAAWVDRVRGCLLGGALGDALGAPFEGWPEVATEQIERHVTAARTLSWTDDTALQLATAAYLATLEGWRAFDDEEHARALANAWAEAPDRGYGSNPPGIFRTVLSGGDWQAAACAAFDGAGSLGNGGAMRAAPLGAVPADAAVLTQLARRMAAVTHAHAVGKDGSVVIALVARTVLATPPGSPPPAGELVEGCLSHLETPEVRRAVGAVPGTLALADPVAVGAVTGTGVAAHEAVAAALSAFLHHPREPLAAMRFAVRMGGDTDTIAAMAGSLGGAACGAEALPGALLDRLESRAQIERVAADLATRSHSVGTPRAHAKPSQ
jgi:poly(ADP-ribose) glycohydrolase ARH3